MDYTNTNHLLQGLLVCFMVFMFVHGYGQGRKN